MKHTFTIFTDDNKIFGYLFNVTRTEAQETVNELNKESNKKYYYVECYVEKEV